MSKVSTAIRNYWAEEDGVVFGEYAMLLGIIGLVGTVGLVVLVAAINGRFTKATNEINAAP